MLLNYTDGDLLAVLEIKCKQPIKEKHLSVSVIKGNNLGKQNIAAALGLLWF